MSVDELISFVHEECKKMGYHYLIQIDDGKCVDGGWDVQKDTRLHDMLKAVLEYADVYISKD